MQRACKVGWVASLLLSGYHSHAATIWPLSFWPFTLPIPAATYQPTSCLPLGF